MQKKISCLIITIVVLMAANLEAGVHNLFWKTHQSRQQEASEWLDGFKKLNAHLPTLSPADQRWLRTEYDNEINRAGGGFTKRALDAMDSKEFALRVAKTHVEKIIGVLSELSHPKMADQRREVIFWANLASLYMDNEFWVAIDNLVQRGVVAKEINGYKSFYRLLRVSKLN
jgi:hypothetical protein